MKFFIPNAKDDKQAEEVYNGIIKFAEENLKWGVNTDRIYSIRYSHEGKDFLAKVGEVENRTKDLVLAILKSTTYLICTINRGGLRGMPILVGENEIERIEYFD